MGDEDIELSGYDIDPGCQHRMFVDNIVHDIWDFKGDVVLPQTTNDVRAFYFRSDMPWPIASIERPPFDFTDKWVLHQETELMGIPRPNTQLCTLKTFEGTMKAIGLPCIVKPASLSGSRGVCLLTDEPDYMGKPDDRQVDPGAYVVGMAQGRAPQEVLLQQYLPGPEYSIDCFRGENGFIAVPRKRVKIRTGISMIAHTCIHTDIGRKLIEYCAIMAEAWDMKYCFGFQFKMSKTGVPRLLECNPRVQGTMIAGVMTGFNFIHAAISEAMGRPVEIPSLSALRDIRLERFWGSATLVKRTEMYLN